jgi:hypothetical protein
VPGGHEFRHGGASASSGSENRNVETRHLQARAFNATRVNRSYCGIVEFNFMRIL